MLYDVDRAIDLYVVGKENFGSPARRAAAYGVVITELIDEDICQLGSPPTDGSRRDIRDTLEQIIVTLSPDIATNTPSINTLINDLLDTATRVRAELVAEGLCSSATDDICIHLDPANPNGDYDRLVARRRLPSIGLGDLTPLYARVRQGVTLLASHQVGMQIAQSIQRFFGGMVQELCVQADMESRWESLVQTMAPSCIPAYEVANRLQTLIRNAIQRLSGEVQCQAFQPSIPPHFETSLDGIADDVDRIGTGRPLLPE